MTRASRIRGVVAATALALAGLTIPLSPTAHEGHGDGAREAEQADPDCGKGQRDLAGR